MSLSSIIGCSINRKGLILLRLYLFLEREQRREKERERNTDVWETHHLVASCMPPTGDLAGNPGMCPDWESNQQPFGSQASTQSTEPHQPGQKGLILKWEGWEDSGFKTCSSDLTETELTWSFLETHYLLSSISPQLSWNGSGTVILQERFHTNQPTSRFTCISSHKSLSIWGE